MKLLVVEDDAKTLEYIRSALAGRGRSVQCACDGHEGLIKASADRHDVLIIDRMLPGLDGLELLKALRTSRNYTPVILLTALGGVADRVEGLRTGADDYLVKPFDLEELDARVEAVGRRAPLLQSVLRKEGLALDRLERRVTIEGAPVDLTVSEFSMLEMLMLNAGKPVTKAMLLEKVFDLQTNSPASIIEPHMSRLRGKLLRHGAADVIRTLRGVGYCIAAL